MLGLVKRTVETRDLQVLLALYKSLVRPHLEYCCSAWNPYYTKDKHLLEKVQHRFTRLFPDLRKLDYYKRLEYTCTCTCTMMDFLSNAACNVHIFPVLV